MLGLHLFLMLRKVKEKGYGPLVLSLVGIGLILAGRVYFQEDKSVHIAGLLLMFLGSLWNSYSIGSLRLLKQSNKAKPAL